MTDVYPRIETGNATPANPPRLLDVVREQGASLALQQAYGGGLCPLDQGLRAFPW